MKRLSLGFQKDKCTTFQATFFAQFQNEQWLYQLHLKKQKISWKGLFWPRTTMETTHCLLGWDGKSIQSDVLKGDLSSLKAGQGSKSCSRGWQILLSCVQDFDKTHDKSFLHCGIWLCLKPHSFLSPAPADCRAKAVRLPHEPEVVRAYAPPSSDRLRERRVVAISWSQLPADSQGGRTLLKLPPLGLFFAFANC